MRQSSAPSLPRLPAGRLVAGDPARQRAQDAEREVLARLRQATYGSHKTATDATRQHLENMLSGQTAMRICALARALEIVPETLRGWVVAPLLQAESPRTKKPLPLETSHVVSAAADLNATVIGALADGKIDRTEGRQIRASVMRVVHEAGDVEVED